MQSQHLSKQNVLPTNTSPSNLQSSYHEKWEIKRRNNTYIIYMYCLLLGTEYSAVVLCLYYYIKNVFGEEHLFLYYSLAMTAMALSATVTCLAFGYYVDYTNNIRRFMLGVISITITGNLLYSLHFSVWFLVCGRFLCGFGEAVNTAAIGKISCHVIMKLSGGVSFIWHTFHA